MAIAQHNIQYIHGDTYKMQATFTRADGSAINLTDGHLEAWIVEDPAAPDDAIQWEIEVDATVAAHNVATFTIPSVVGLTLDPDKTYHYDVEFSSGSGASIERYTTFGGTISLIPSITTGTP